MKASFLFFPIFLAFSFFIGFQSVYSQKKKERLDKMVPYSKKTFKTLKGTVKGMKIVFNRFMKEYGLHITLKTASGDYIVHVCPKWYADKMKITFAKGEKLTISGSTFSKNKQKNIYAATIIRGSSKAKPMKLRNPDTGKGLWSGRHYEKRSKKRKANSKRKRQN